MKITIVRTSINDKSITGELYVDDKFICHTLELPYHNNASYISSIPSGTYGAILRYDHEDKWRIEFTGTLPRTNIQIHVGNTPSDIEGCVLVGDAVLNINNRIEGGTSKPAYTRLKQAFYGTPNPISTPNNPINIEIKYNLHPIVYSGGNLQITYQDKGTWVVKTNDTLTYQETKRDLNYIYLHANLQNNASAEIKLPLFGGQVSYMFKAPHVSNPPWSVIGVVKRSPIVNTNFIEEIISTTNANHMNNFNFWSSNDIEEAKNNIAQPEFNSNTPKPF